MGKVYFATSDSAMVSCGRCEVRRRDFFAQADVPMFGSPAIAGDLLYQPSEDGKLHTVDFENAKPSWEFQTEASQQNSRILIARRQSKLCRGLHGKLL